MPTNLNPFDLRGPEFLFFYAVLIAATAIAAYVVRRFAAASSDRPGPVPTLDRYEVAYLVGGAKRVMLLATATLLDHQRIELSGKNIEIQSGTDRAAHVVERTILRDPSSTLSLSDARNRIGPICDNFERTLQNESLLANDASRQMARGGTVIPFVVTLGIGLGKAVIGSSRNKPIGFLILMILATVPIAWAMFPRHLLTPRGRELVAKMKADVPNNPAAVSSRGRLADSSTVTGDAGLGAMIALWGVAALAEHPDHAQLKRTYDSSFAGVDYGGSSCSSGSSSCSSGSSCGGGGCGGCGSS